MSEVLLFPAVLITVNIVLFAGIVAYSIYWSVIKGKS